MNPLYTQALIGGILIGISVHIFSGGLGRVMGVSGIIKGIFPKSEPDIFWRYTFLLGLIGGVALYRYLRPESTLILSSASSTTLVIAGILVGLGTSLANGCTSGHAVCGIGRLSIRSIIATLTFVMTGVITVFITHHII